MPRLTNKEIDKLIKKNIRKFHKLNKQGKRLMIIDDAINQIELNKIDPVLGTYHKSDTLAMILGKEATPEFYKNKCMACAIGSMFICTVRMSNNFTPQAKHTGNEWDYEVGDKIDIGDLDDEEISRPTLRKYFSRTQIGLIETAFMGEDYFRYEALEFEDVQDSVDAKDYRGNIDLFDSGDKRGALLAILRNMKRNKGIFKPKDLKV